MAIQDDFSINYSTKKISHTSGSTRYTVNALYSWLMDLFDDSGQMDDTVPMSAQTPTEYTLINGWTFNADSDLGYLYGGSIVVQKNTSDRDIWANFYTLGTIEADSEVYWLQNGSLVASHPGYVQGHIDQLIKTMAAGSLIDSGNVTSFIRNRDAGGSDLYDNFTGQATATGGRNPIPLATSTDTNDDGSDVSAYTITLAFGSFTEDVDADGTAESYGAKVDGVGTYTALQCYNWLRWKCRRENASDIGNGVEGRFYRYINAAYAETKQAPFGTFAGGKFFGARGVLLTNITDSNNRQLIDSAGVTRTPPTTVAITVTGTQANDRVLVARATAGVINKSQFTAAGAHTNASTVTVNEALGNDIPSSGYLRFGDARHTYSGINRAAKQFTGVSPTVTCADLAPLYSPYIDGLSGTDPMSKSIVYVADFDTVCRSRQKGILPFENTGTVGVNGATFSVIRTTDTIVT